MQRLILKRVSVEAFSSFTEETVIDFNPPGLLCLSGLNGRGKSSIAEAIAYPLGFNTYSASDLQSWHTKKPLSVTLWFDSESGELELTKGIKKTSLCIAGTEFKGSVAQIDEKLKDIIGLDSEMLALLSYRAQKQSGLLLSLPDADKKEFLTKLLPMLRKLEEELEKSKGKGTQLDIKLSLSKDRVNGLSMPEKPDPEYRLKFSNRIVELTASKRVIEQSITDLNRQVAILKSNKNVELGLLSVIWEGNLAKERQELPKGKSLELDFSKVNELEEALEDCKNRVTLLELDDANILASINSEKKEIEKEINHKKLLASKKDGYQEKLTELNYSLRQLNDNKCPTCLRQWEEVQVQINETKSLIIEVQNESNKCDEYLLQARQLEGKLDSIIFTPNPDILELKEVKEEISKQYNEENNRLSTIQATYHAEEGKLKAEQDARIASVLNNKLLAENDLKSKWDFLITGANDEIHNKQSDIQAVTGDINQLGYEVKRYEDLEKHYNDKKDEFDKISNEIKELEHSLSIELEFTRCLKEFLGSVFEEVLDTIADEANKTLASIDNTAYCSIKFNTENITQKGSVQKKIVPVISIAGNESSIVISKGRPKCSGISGGMMATIELAVDLALSSVISQSSGVDIGWLIVDEAMEGMDYKSKEASLEILRKYSNNKLIIVVDHMSEFTSLFDRIINVEMKEGHSYICP